MERLEHEWPDPDRRDVALTNLAAAIAVRPQLTETLTERGAQVLGAASYGLEASEIAEVIGITEETVKDHLRIARRSMRAKNTTHACCEAIRHGLIT